MIGGNRIVEVKIVEQLALIALQPPHHRKPPPSMWCEDGIIARRRQQRPFATKSALLGPSERALKWSALGECVAKLLEGVPGGFPSASCRNLDSQTFVLGIVIPDGAAVGI